MRRSFLFFCFVSLIFWRAFAQSPNPPNEGSKLTKDAANAAYTLSWKGKTGRTYFIQHSEDLLTWRYFPIIEIGNNLPIAWDFESNAQKFFLRFKYSDQPTSDPFADDFDADRVSNFDELLAGTDPFVNANADSDALPDDWEIQHFGSNNAENGGPNDDPDGDGLTNFQEFTYYSDPMDFGNRTPHPLGDSDTNGLADWWEIQNFGHLGNNPNAAAAGKGGLTLKQVFDNDLDLTASSTVGDDIPDSWKIANGFNATDPKVVNEDPDGDGLTNGDEFDVGTNPQAEVGWDTDGDGIEDGADLAPLIPNPALAQNVRVAVPSTEDPNAPAPDYTNVELRWDTATGATGYRVERRADSDVWTNLSTLGAAAISCADAGLVASRHYEYRVTAFKDFNNQHIEAPAAHVTYAVPLGLSIVMKISSGFGSKRGFTEFATPSSPPKYYLVQTDTSSMSGSYSTQAGDTTPFSTKSGSYDSVETINPALDRTDYSFSYSYSSSDLDDDGTVTHSYSETMDYSSLNQYRTKLNPVRLSERTYSMRIGGTGGIDNRDGDYSLRAELQLGEGAPLPRWMGWDFENWDELTVWSGTSHLTTHSEYGNIFNTEGEAEADENGEWSGTINHKVNGIEQEPETVNEPVWSGSIGSYSGWFQGTPQVTPTKKTYDHTSPWGQLSTHSTGTQELSGEYLTSAFVTDVFNDMSDYPEEWDTFAGFGWHGWRIADRWMNADQDSFSLMKATYKLKTNPSAPMTLKWSEVFFPADDPATPTVDESLNVEIIAERSWDMGPGSNRERGVRDRSLCWRAKRRLRAVDPAGETQRLWHRRCRQGCRRQRQRSRQSRAHQRR